MKLTKKQIFTSIGLLFLVLLPTAVYFVMIPINTVNTKPQHAPQKPSVSYSSLTEGPGLGQCHWIGGPFNSNAGIRWGYSSSTPFYFEAPIGGDSWASIEQTKGVYTFTQLHSEVEAAKGRGKQVWLQIQVADNQNKEHNVPKWALDEGVEVIPTTQCNDDSRLSYNEIPWNNNSSNSVQPNWNNPKYVDQSEAVLLDINGNVTTNTANAHTVRFPNKIAAIWDPKYREYYGRALLALRQEFQSDLNSGAIQAIVLMSGGRYGECALSASCAGWEEWAGTCIPDVLNPECPAVKSMAKFVQAQHYPELTVDQVTRQIVSKKSNCNATNTTPGTKVELCTELDPMNCPTEYGSFCYVFDDYFIQAEKDLIRRYVEALAPTPIVWQDGGGLSGTGRVNRILKSWLEQTYGTLSWLKFNGWGPSAYFFGSRNFSSYSGVGAQGYEPGHPHTFTKEHFQQNAQAWCDDYLSEACDGDTNCLPQECKTTPLNPDAVGRRAIVIAIKRGIVDDRSSYLCMQSDFFSDPPTDDDGDGLKENIYYFNPDDQDANCSSSEINVATFGYGFCPGYLNHIMTNNVPKPINWQCTPNCTGKECGSNGCGGSCGTCTSPEICNDSGVCVPPACTPNCTGKTCGDSDGCGGKCTACPTGQTCNTNTWACQSACTPTCTGRECGSDGCTGSCGTCTPPETCVSGICSCTRNCIGKMCGQSDGCTGRCTACPTGQTCNMSSWTCQNVCTPYCTGKECGTNGCGGSCGTCTSPETCNDSGLCVVTESFIGDLNDDGKVSVSDYALFIADYLRYLEQGATNTRSDLNNDDIISVSDYALFIQSYLDYIHQ